MLCEWNVIRKSKVLDNDINNREKLRIFFYNVILYLMTLNCVKIIFFKLLILFEKC